MKLHHIAVVSRNAEDAERFYGKFLGLQKKKTSHLDKSLSKALFRIESDAQMIFYQGDEIAVEVFVPEIQMSTSLTFTHSCFSVADRTSFIQNCRAEGVCVFQAEKGGTPVFFISDYDGNLFEIKEL